MEHGLDGAFVGGALVSGAWFGCDGAFVGGALVSGAWFGWSISGWSVGEWSMVWMKH